MTVGEGLATRGWGAEGLRGRRRVAAWAGAALLALGVLVWWLMPARVSIAVLIALAGGGLLLLALARGGVRSRYRPERWNGADTVVAGACVGILAVAVLLTAWHPLLLAYEPYPRSVWPRFDWPIGLALVLLGLPGFVLRRD